VKTLIAWDDATEVEVLRLYLSTGENEAAVALTAAELLLQVAKPHWDAILMALTFPDSAEEGFRLFRQVREALPAVPVVLACRPTELLRLPLFLNNGLRFHLTRDNQSDFVFLVLSSLESAMAAARAEESHRRYERLRHYLAE